MDVESIKLLSAAFAIGFAASAAAIGESWIAVTALNNMGRNPEVANKLFTNMIVAMAITESNSIYALVVSLIILFAA
jgi:F-type H+-transporting ATPase subunit c